MKFLTKQGLQHFLDRLKGIIPSKTSDLTNDSGFLTSHNPVDSALSLTSTNAVQNKVVKDALDEKSDTGHTHSASDVSGLSTVATSGSYNDLSNKPTIPTVNNATLTIQKNGSTVKTFTANASSNVTANITVPTKTSDLTNDSGFLTSHNPIDSALSSTSTNAVQNKVVNDALTGKSDTGHSHTVSDISDFPTLSTVATSGSYNDLSNKPTIPTVNNKTLTIQKNGTNVATFTANSSSNVTANITVPTNVSELTNDSGYLTASSNLDSSKLTGTIDIARLPKGALERLVTVSNQTARFALTSSDVQLGDTVKQLDTGVMYIVSDESKLSSNDGYTEYTAGSATSVPWSGVSGKPSSFTPSSHTHGSITNDGKLGTASRVLVTDSSKKIAVSSVTSTELGYLSGVTSAIQTQLDGKAASSHTHTASDVSGLSTVATSGSYDDLSNKPTIPTVNNATLTIQKNGTTVKTFTANASSNVTANITVPTKTSELTNDSHQTITTDTDTTSAESPAHSGTFTCIDSVTRDSNGHVTKVNTKTITLPSDNNTDTLVAQNYSTANNSYPVVFSNVAGVSSTSNRGNKGTIVNNAIYANPSTGSLYATKLYSGGNEVLTSHQSLSNYSTLANTVKSLSISGKTITVTPGSGSAYTLTTQDTVYTHPTTSGNKHIPSGGSSGQFLGWDSDGTAKWVSNPNSDTKMTQNVSTTNATYPVLLVATADATANQGAKTGIFAKSVKVNPSTNVISASGFSGPLTGDVTGNVTGNCSGSSGSCTGLAAKATGNANGKELSNSIIKGLSVSGKTITYTQIDGNTGTITTQDTNTDTLMTQNVSTTNATYPVLLVATADATANQGAKTGIFAKSVKVNPSTNVISASGFSGPLMGDVTGNVTGNCSGSSGSCTGLAAKATGDVDGNAIKTTYAKLASPALTGTPTAPTAALGVNTTQIATTAFVYNNASKHLSANKSIYVSITKTGDGSGSDTSNYMPIAYLRTYLATVHMHSLETNLDGSYNLQILFKAGASFGNATFDAAKMPGVRNLILNTSTGTNSTTSNYSTNSPTFGNITVTGDISVTMRNLNCTGRISSQYGAYVSIDTYMGIASLQASNYGYLNVAKNMVINVCDAHTDYLFSATNNGILAMWPGATVTINFRQQCYYTRSLFLASSNGTAWIGYSSFKLTGTEPMAVWGSSGTLTGTSDTAAATVEKAVTLASGQTFTLTTNATAKVKFTIDNTAANPTLNIGGTGAKPIYWNNAAVPAAMIMKNIVYDVKYNGSQFVIQNGVKRLTNNDFGVFRSTGNYNQTYNSGSWNFTGWTLYYGTGIENSNWRGSHIGNIQQNVTTSNKTFPVLFSGTANATANTSTAPYFGTGVKINPSTSEVIATKFTGSELNLKHSSYIRGNLPSTNAYTNFCINDSNGTLTARILRWINNDGDNAMSFQCWNAQVTTDISSAIQVGYNSSGNGFARVGGDNFVYFYPINDNAYDLGTASNRWKTLNGVKPGALSLPSTSTDPISTNGWDFANYTANSFTAPGNGYISVGMFADSIQIANDTRHMAMTATKGADGYTSLNLFCCTGDTIRVLIKNRTSTNYQQVVFVPTNG